ncbi:major outer membrane protein OmpA [Bacteroidia bacterium]|nr:major outer membrane protein OmpA [Bacteroidia bacterium]GHV30714.1 major outer membrane protein OmpA [Bacteroidia bacterium]
MKKVINLLVVLVLLTFAFPALAQDEERSLSEIALRKTHSDNWYVSLGPSLNILFAEQDGLKSAGSRMKFGGEFSVGKWFNPNTGISFNIMGGGLRGFNELRTPYEGGYYTLPDNGHSNIHDGGFGVPMGGPFYENGKWNSKYTEVKGKNGERGFWQDFKYVVPTIDIMANLTNLFRGYAVERSWFELVAFGGLGVNIALDNGSTTPDFYFLAARMGLRANFNVNKNVAIYLEPTAYATDPEFDGYKGTAIGDAYTSLSLGVQYTFNRRVSSFEKLTIDELDRLNRRVNENRDLIENHQDILERQQKLLDKLGNSLSSAQTEKTIPIIHNEASKVLPEYVRFALNSYTIEKSEYSKINGVVDFLKSNPTARILLVGYADRKTGNPTYNYNLSKKRVDAVANEIKRFGVDGNRVFIEWKGDKEQPFTANEWNRVVIMVERK